ncbi:hypothetical protein EV714DRAFT_270307 [Schizophyllum commune]
MPDVQDQETPWEGCFMQLVRTHITRDPLEFDDRILRLPIVKEDQARLDARRVPHHPLEPADTLAVDEAIQALVVYWNLLEPANACGGAIAKQGLAPFDSIWRWIVFLLPSSGNVRDDGRTRYPRPKFVDGQFALGLLPLEYVLRQYLASMLMYEEGRNRCLAQPDFVAVFVDVYTSYVSGRKTAMDGKVSHFTGQALARLLDNPYIPPRLLAEIGAYDAQHPAAFLHELVAMVFSFFDHDFDHNLIPPYLSIITRLLAFDDMAGNLVVRDGIKKMVGILIKTASYPVGKAIAPALTIAQHCAAQIVRLSARHDILEDALDSGSLAYVMAALVDENRCLRPVEWRIPPAELIRGVLSSRLIWPTDIVMINREVKSLRIAHYTGDDPPVLPELNQFVGRLRWHDAARKDLKATLGGLKRCHNEDMCPSDGEQSRDCKLRRCGRAFYCSRECQKVHWRMGHREVCGTADERRFMRYENPRICLRPFERCFVKRLAWDFAEDVNLHHSYGMAVGRAVLIKLDEGPKLAATTIRDPLSASDPPRVYARVRRGPEESIVLIGTLGAAFW